MGKKKTRTRPYVSSVTSNLKSPRPLGDEWSIELGQYTLLVGSNTSHKSSVVQSVELGLTGAADDIVGRSDVKDGELLLSLAPADELGVTVKLTDDNVGSFSVKRDGGKVKRPNHTGPGGMVLTHRAVKAALSGSTATKRKAFLTWASSDVELDDVLAHLPTPLHSKYRDVAEHIGRGKSAADALLAVVEYAGRRSREISKEKKGAEAIIDGMDSQLDSRPTDEDVESLREAVRTAQTALEEAAAANAGMNAKELELARAEARDAVADWSALARDTAESLETVRAAMPDAPGNMVPSLQVLDWALGQGIEACPICSSQVGASHLSACRDFYQNMKSTWETANATTAQTLVVMEAKLTETQAAVQQWTQKLAELDNLDPVESGGVSLDEARDRLTAATSALNSTEIALSKWDQVSDARRRIKSLDDEADSYKLMKKEGEACVGALLAEQTEAFSERVQDYLPEAWEFGVTLYEGGRETFQMGIMRDGKLHAALSGAEWATLTTAIAMAVSDMMPSREPSVLIPEDRAWDGKTLSSVMRAFRDFDGQVLMASTIRPTGRAPAGWTIIDMDDVSASWLAPDGGSEEEAEVEVESKPEKPVRTKLRKKGETKKAKGGGMIVTTRSAVVLQGMGYSHEETLKMTKETAAALITQGLTPEKVEIKDDGSYAELKAGQVLKLPPPPNGC